MPLLFLLLFLFGVSAKAQTPKDTYLRSNSFVLDANYTLDKQVLVMGFGAYHGSAKTEEVEINLLKSYANNNGLDVYFAETDISIAYYLNEYLKNGDEKLLLNLLMEYGTRVPQERTVEVFNKWRNLRNIYEQLPADNKFTVLGAEPIVTYKYIYKHILSLIIDKQNWENALVLENTVLMDTTDYSPYYESHARKELKRFVSDYQENGTMLDRNVRDNAMFNYLINLVKKSFSSYHREEQMYENYLKLSEMYDLKTKRQFFRLGFSHLLKDIDGKNSSFFARLIAGKLYHKQEVTSVTGYLSDSKVIWRNKFDDNDNFVSSETLGDEGIGDGLTGYYEGIDNLKNNAKGDITIFKLTGINSPYKTNGCTDLIRFIDKKESTRNYHGKTTTNYIDYAILIKHSEASTSLYSLEKK